MRRRIVWATAVLAVLLVVPAVPASAADFTLAEPDGDVTGATPLEVHLERDFGGERLRRVRVALELDGARLGTPVDLHCHSGCDIGEPTGIFVLPDDGLFEPSTGAPFGIEAPMANGTYRLRVDLIKDSAFQSDERFDADIHLAVPPRAPKQVGAEVDGREVALTWQAAPEPDVERYRVEWHDGDGWKELATTSSTTHVDEAEAGTHRYRVVALRSDGRGGTLETASPEQEVEIAGRRNGDDGGEADDDETTAQGDRDANGDEDDRDAEGDDDATTADDAGSSDASSQRGTSRSGTPPADAPSTGGDRRSIPGVASGEEGYASELDYGALGDGEAADDVRVGNPGFFGSMERIFDAERVAVPVAAGLVMTGMGLHLWRWLRVPLP